MLASENNKLAVLPHLFNSLSRKGAKNSKQYFVSFAPLREKGSEKPWQRCGVI
jgi:hypothetical protein